MATHRTPSGGRHRTLTTRSLSPRPWSPRPATAAVLTAAAAVTVGGPLAGPAVAASSDDTTSEQTGQNARTGQDAPTEETPAARAAHAEPRVPGTPCSASARACVDLETQRAWLIDDGEVVRGPMRIASGGEGQETPVGHSFRVYRKDADHVSRESQTRDGRPAPMPYSTFFADGGIAFHAGDPARSSAGCIRMEPDDAEALFDDLRTGDKVQVVNGSEEKQARQRA